MRTSLKKWKNGQVDTVGAATLIALIALFIVLYILFLPESEREKILNESYEYGSEDDNKTDDKIDINETLLRAYPGSIDYIKARAQEYQINSISLSSTPITQEIYSTNTILTEKSLFGQKTETITFDVDNCL